jgi:hypothetical protein
MFYRELQLMSTDVRHSNEKERVEKHLPKNEALRELLKR